MTLKSAMNQFNRISSPSDLATCNAYLGIRAMELAKKAKPDVPTVTGGQHFTATADGSLKNYPEIDVIVRGEVGEALSLKHLKRNPPLNKELLIQARGEDAARPATASFWRHSASSKPFDQLEFTAEAYIPNAAPTYIKGTINISRTTISINAIKIMNTGMLSPLLFSSTFFSGSAFTSCFTSGVTFASVFTLCTTFFFRGKTSTSFSSPQ